MPSPASSTRWAALHAYVFVLDLMDLSMDKAVYLMPCGGGGELYRAGTLDRPLGGQLFLGGFQPGPRSFPPFPGFLKSLVSLGIGGLLLSLGGVQSSRRRREDGRGLCSPDGICSDWTSGHVGPKLSYPAASFFMSSGRVVSRR